MILMLYDTLKNIAITGNWFEKHLKAFSELLK